MALAQRQRWALGRMVLGGHRQVVLVRPADTTLPDGRGGVALLALGRLSRLPADGGSLALSRPCPAEYHVSKRWFPSIPAEEGAYMHRIAAAVVVALLVLPALADDDKPKDKAKEKAKSTESVPAVPLIQKGGGGPEAAKPGTPAAEYQALVKEYSEAQQAISKAYEEAKDEDKPALLREKLPKVIEKSAVKFLGLAEKHPRDPVAVDSLVWVVANSPLRRMAKDSCPVKALTILMRDYVISDRIGEVCQPLTYQMYDSRIENLLHAILEKNPTQSVQAEACLALAQGLQQQAGLLRQLLNSPDQAKAYEEAFGKEYVEALQKKTPDNMEAESKQFFQRFEDEYLSALKPERLANYIQLLGYSPEKRGEERLRSIVEKDQRREVQGMACLTLAQLLKRQANAQPGEQGGKLRKESEALFEKAIEKYGDVQMHYYGTVGKRAKSELHALRFLSVGKPAPEVEGVDQDGKKFKLSDHKGKVVLLDFWSQF
jgi:hypothetical protein